MPQVVNALEASQLADAHHVAEAVYKRLIYSDARYDGYLAAKAEAARDAIFDLFNSSASFGDDLNARAWIQARRIPAA